MFCSRCGHQVDEGAKFCPSCGLDLTVVTPGGARLSAEPTAELTEADAVKAALSAEYELKEELGRGGMAIVYRALDRQLEREVALKVLPFSLAFDAEFVERFQREARTAARLEHPNIIPIYRVGRSGRVIYFVMKLLRGTSLSELLEKRGPLPPAEIRSLLAQTAGALGYAHKHGIVHRDIKPDNIMFDELGHALVTDFGIAKAASGTRLTGTGMAIGTPHYMSPEQARAQPMDGRSDVYSLGVVGYQCLAGKVPYDGEDAFSIGYKHIMDELPVPPLETAEARRLFAVLRRMLSKAAEDRYQNAEEVIGDLEEAKPAGGTATSDLSSAPTMALPAVEGARPSGGRPSSGRPTTPTTPRPRTEPRWRGARDVRKRKRGGGILVAALVLGLLGGGGAGGWYAYTRYFAPERASAAAPAGPAVVNPTVLTLPPSDSAVVAGRDSVARADSVRLAALPDSGWLTVTGAPPGARFWVDDEPYATNVIRVGIGSHQLRVRASGFQDYTTLVSVAKGDSASQAVRLDRAPAATAAAPPPRQTAPTRPAAPPVRPAATEAGTCDSPFEPTFNKDGACFDTPPAPTANLVVPLDATVSAPPRPVFLWVRVGADGRPVNVAVPPRPGSDPSFVVLARGFARQQRYQPALKNGQPVEAWFQFRFVPQLR